MLLPWDRPVGEVSLTPTLRGPGESHAGLRFQGVCTRGLGMDDTHRPAKQGRGVHPPWSWKPQRPMEVGYPKVFIRLKVLV